MESYIAATSSSGYARRSGGGMPPPLPPALRPTRSGPLLVPTRSGPQLLLAPTCSGPLYSVDEAAPAAGEPPSPHCPHVEIVVPSMQTAVGGLRVTFENVRYSIPDPKKRGARLTLLRGVTGEFDPGEMCAILGPSGSGKSTFLDLLAGRKNQGELRGAILYGGLKPARDVLRRHVGYVEQRDTLVDTLTVGEMLMYTASLKRPLSEPRAAVRAAVDALVRKLGLTPCHDTVIGSPLRRGISGGQAKRANIALALVADARVLLLDEPTSGLDSFTANEVMALVKSLGRDGTTVALTIHSPSASTFGLFDRLLVLLAGRAVFFGGAGREMAAYFVSHCGAPPPAPTDNLAEWLLDFTIRRERAPGGAAALADAYAGSYLAAATAVVVHDAVRRERELAAAAAANGGGRLSLAASLGLTARPSLASGRASFAAGGGDCSGGGGGGGVWTAASVPASARVSTASGAVTVLGPKKGEWMAVVTGGTAYVTPWWWTLLMLLWHRSGRNYKAPSYVLPRVFDRVAFIILLVVLYWGLGADSSPGNVPNLGALLYLGMSHPAYSAVNFLAAFMADRPLYVRERADGLYRPTVYLAWKMLDELTLQLVVLCGVDAALFYACRLRGSFLFFHATMVLTTMSAISIAYTLASLTPSTEVGSAATLAVITILTMLSGFMIRENAVPALLRPAVKLNLMHHLWGGLMVNHFEGAPGGARVLAFFQLAGASKWALLGYASAWFGGATLAAWLALAYVRQHRR